LHLYDTGVNFIKLQQEYLVAGAALKEAENQFDQLLTTKNTRKTTANNK
jgi:hypothetical protein